MVVCLQEEEAADEKVASKKAAKKARKKAKAVSAISPALQALALDGSTLDECGPARDVPGAVSDGEHATAAAATPAAEGAAEGKVGTTAAVAAEGGAASMVSGFRPASDGEAATATAVAAAQGVTGREGGIAAAVAPEAGGAVMKSASLTARSMARPALPEWAYCPITKVCTCLAHVPVPSWLIAWLDTKDNIKRLVIRL